MEDFPDHVFVYGTLRSTEQRNHALDSCEKIGDTWTTPGRLMSLGPYPALIPEESGRVIGEVFNLGDTHNKTAVISLLDRIEGISFGLFQRHVANVTNEDGETLECLVYILGPRLENQPMAEITSGDWQIR